MRSLRCWSLYRGVNRIVLIGLLAESVDLCQLSTSALYAILQGLNEVC